MQKTLFLTASFSMALLLSLNIAKAQTTYDANFAIQITIDGQTNVIRRGECGYSAPQSSGTTVNEWGGPLLNDICAQLAWADGDTSGILACDPVENDLTGKIALIRRGVCNFSLKAYLAQQAGAIAVMIVNNNVVGTENECTVVNMAGGLMTDSVTIPVVFLARQSGNPLAAALDAGKNVDVCWHLLSLRDPYAEYSHCTPVSQIRPMDLISVSGKNLTGIEQAFTFHADITDPNGTLTTLTAAQVLGVDSTAFISFDAYTPPAVVGLYTIQYSTDKAIAISDTLTRTFRITPSTWATDNLTNIRPGPSHNVDFPISYTTGSIVRTGPNGAEVSRLTFGISNPESIYDAANPAANAINLLLYDADANNDGINDLQTNFSDMGTNYVAFNVFMVTEDTDPDSLYSVELFDINGAPTVTLKPNHLYYSVLSYEISGGTGNLPVFLSSGDVAYGEFVDAAGNSLGLSAPIQYATLSSWSGVKEVIRLNTGLWMHADNTAPNSLLSKSQYSVSPNPANDQVALNLNLNDESAYVRVSLIDFTCKTVSTQIVRNFTSGRIAFDTKALPSGAYAMVINTAEGIAMVNVTICH